MTKGRAGKPIGEIRLSGGEYGGRRLRGAPGVRPTPALAREALFDILRSRLEGARVLDVYAGTGAVGLEALGRGADRATLIERSRAALAALEENIDRLECRERTKVIAGDAVACLRGGRLGGDRFDLIFMDPPYDRALCLDTLLALPAEALAPEGLVIVQSSPRERPPDIAGSLRRADLRIYGEAVLHFYARPSPSDSNHPRSGSS